MLVIDAVEAKMVPEGLKVVLEGLKALQGRLIQEAGRLGEPARG